ncbi:subtilisin family serine protease [Actinoalloteichus hoggarensis]|uniref:Bacillopeptidase F n=1 Tax=Actinoalloteichus hoggarensis TaxID=1470176 RepID=A0A221W1R4_9PSEU|nr:S8 family serine peptidase [Actinoalloteichus hoggarensis]ASO19752.1 Bacillopeptidase F precursor [Actinoalloteichus hoggarensis]MBB5919540.1 subtilisin family serine protease [Actinoalloteichus hoggarensis]
MPREVVSARPSRRVTPRIGARRSVALALPVVIALTAAAAAPSIAQPEHEDRSGPASVDADVAATLAADGAADVWIVLDEQADLSAAAAVADWDERGQAVVDTLRGHAERTQADAVALLSEWDADFTPYWIANRILVRDASAELTDSITTVSGVERITLPAELAVPEPTEAVDAAPAAAVEWGIESINADDVWSEYGVTGEGIVVASIDSGAEFDHPALVDSYRGNLGDGVFDHDHSWFDATTDCGSPSLVPCDNHRHGTHVTGTMIGDDGAGNQIGVAPGAQWIAAKGCRFLGCAEPELLAAGQWMLAPTAVDGENPRADLRPHVVNNSWGSVDGAIIDPWYDEVLAAWTASGIFGVFANGNSGPDCGTAASPANSPFSYGVGAYAADGTIASFSSRGPGPEGAVHPNIAAPGVAVRSSVRNGAYASLNGTSMAAPHVVGAVALVWSAAPSLVGDVEATRALFDTTAIDVDDTSCGGTAADNNVWGEGRLDVLAAVAAAPRAETGELTGTVTDAATGEPVAGARVTIAGPQDRDIVLGADGAFTRRLAVGDYTVTTSAFGYGAESATATVRTDEATTIEQALTILSTQAVRGTVTDSHGAALDGIEITIGRGVLPAETTDQDGGFVFESVPEGAYALSAAGSACLAPETRDVVVAGDTVIVEVTLPDVTDAYGYSCRDGGDVFLAGEDRLRLSGWDQATSVALPFPVEFFGEQYSRAFVGTNGILNFLTPSPGLSTPPGLPDPALPNAVVAPFWTTINVTQPAGVYTGLHGGPGERVFVIEWRDVRPVGFQPELTFAVQLHETGEIVFAYDDLPADDPVALGSRSTVGIENADGADGLQYSHHAPILSSGTSIRFDTLDDAGTG